MAWSDAARAAALEARRQHALRKAKTYSFYPGTGSGAVSLKARVLKGGNVDEARVRLYKLQNLLVARSTYSNSKGLGFYKTSPKGSMRNRNANVRAYAKALEHPFYKDFVKR